jgi:cell division protease FtsH
LTENLDKLHSMTALLVKYETIDSHQIDAIMEGSEPGAPKDWTDTPSTPNEDSSSSDSETSGKPADQLH